MAMLYILGAGGYGRETFNLLIDLGKKDKVLGFLEDNSQRKGTLMLGKPIDDTKILETLDRKAVKLVSGIGSPLRRNPIERIKKLGYSFETLIHPSAVKSEWVELGEGVVVHAGNILTTQISIGRFSYINLASTIGHDVKIGEYTSISPGVHISGHVVIGDRCFIGTGTVIREGVTISNDVFIGAGSVVVDDIPENVLAYGVPAKPVRTLTEEDWKKLI